MRKFLVIGSIISVIVISAFSIVKINEYRNNKAEEQSLESNNSSNPVESNNNDDNKLNDIQFNFFYNKDNSSADITFKYNELLNSSLPKPSRDGYEFICWKSFKNDEIIENNDMKNIESKELDLYADWEVINYNIFYYNQFGNIITPSSEHTYNITSKIDFSDAPKIEGIVVLNWKDENDKIIVPEEHTTGDINCYPVYAKEKITINFETRNDITNEVNYTIPDKEIDYNYGLNYILPIPSISGYRFIGWYSTDYIKQLSDESGKLLDNNLFLDDTKLFAKWIKTDYSFNLTKNDDGSDYKLTLLNGNSYDKLEILVSESDISNDRIYLSNLTDAIKEKNEAEFYKDQWDSDTYYLGHHLIGFTSVINDLSTRVYDLSVEQIEQGISIFPYYEANIYRFEIYNDTSMCANFVLNYDTLFDDFNNKQSHFTVTEDFNKTGYDISSFYLVFLETKYFDLNGVPCIEGIWDLQKYWTKQTIELNIKYIIVQQ